jgi:hypothetical protein
MPRTTTRSNSPASSNRSPRPKPQRSPCWGLPVVALPEVHRATHRIPSVVALLTRDIDAWIEQNKRSA